MCNWACLVIGTNKHLGCSWLLAPALTTPLPPRGEASLCRGLLCQARLKGVHKTAADFMTHNMQYFICRQGQGSEFSGLLPSHVDSEKILSPWSKTPPSFITLLCFQEALSSFLSTFGSFAIFAATFLPFALKRELLSELCVNKLLLRFCWTSKSFYCFLKKMLISFTSHNMSQYNKWQ